jgi:hypothetical protein
MVCAQLCGTSLQMIEATYGHLIQRDELTAPMRGAVVSL